MLNLSKNATQAALSKKNQTMLVAEDSVTSSQNSRASMNSVLLVENNKEPYEITILLLGDCRTGKTSLITSLLSFSQESASPRPWNSHYEPTLLEDEFMMQCMVDGYPIKLKLIDTAGHSEAKQMEQFEYQSSRKSLQQNWWQEADGYIMVCDATNRATFESLENYYKMLLLIENNHMEGHKAFSIVATKVDSSAKRQVSTEEIEAFASSFFSLGSQGQDNTVPIPFFEVSIKEQPEKVQFVWNQIILYTLRQQMLKKMFLEDTNSNKKRTSVRLSNSPHKSVNLSQSISPRGDATSKQEKRASRSSSSGVHKLFAHKSRMSTSSQSDFEVKVSNSAQTSENQIKNAIDELLEAQRETKAKLEAEEQKKKKKFKLFSFFKKPKLEHK